jgi:hypothetical protein
VEGQHAGVDGGSRRRPTATGGSCRRSTAAPTSTAWRAATRTTGRRTSRASRRDRYERTADT